MSAEICIINTRKLCSDVCVGSHMRAHWAARKQMGSQTCECRLVMSQWGRIAQRATSNDRCRLGRQRGGL